VKCAVIGTVGVPGRYGGFETLAENLTHYHADHSQSDAELGELTVYCSAPSYPERLARYRNANLRYSRFKANGMQSVIYDSITALDAARRGHQVLLVLGVSGAVVLPMIRLIAPRCQIVTNIDGIEWKREKWQGLAKRFLRWSEKLAVHWSHVVVADNRAIAEHVHHSYGVKAEIIAYGGDHAVAPVSTVHDADLLSRVPASYAIGLCRIEPENNVAMILEAFAGIDASLVFVGNWENSNFGRGLKDRYSKQPNIHLLDSVYNPATLQVLRQHANVYIHGHSAGGTNPSLVEMMHFGIPVYAFDCTFNRHTTNNLATYFSSAEELAQNVTSPTDATKNGDQMREIAQAEYTWDIICRRYFELMTFNNNSQKGEIR